MSKTLFVSDLDGTLLGADARLSNATVSLLNESIRDGALFTVATARTPATVDILLSDVDMKLPAIVMTGAALWSFDTHRYCYPHFIPHNDLIEALKLFDNFGIYPFIYTLDDESSSILKVYYSNPHPSPADENFIAQRSHLPLKRFIRTPLTSLLPSTSGSFSKNGVPTILLFASGAKDTLSALHSALSDRISTLSVSCYNDIYNPGTGLIEVFAPHTSKALALERLRTQLGVESVVVFGDSENDLPMFAIADKSVAVANATPTVLEAADYIIGPNTNDSVAKFIRQSI